MTTLYFRNAGTDWDDVNNWSTSSGGAAGSEYPEAGDDAIFDANSGDCTLDADAACDNLTFNGYTNTFDAATFNVTISVDMDGTGGGSASVDMGSGTWEVSGNWNSAAIGTLEDGSSLLKMMGTTKTFQTGTGSGDAIHDLEIHGTITIDTGSRSRMNGTLVIKNGATFTIDKQLLNTTSGGGATCTLEAGGTLAGTANLSWTSDLINNGSATTSWGVADTVLRKDTSLGGTQTTWDTNIKADFSSGTSRTTTLNHSPIITGDFTLDGNMGSGDTYTFNMDSETLTVHGHITIECDVGGTLNISNAGTWKLASNSDQTITIIRNGTFTDSLGALSFEKSGGTVTLAGSSGDIDIDSYAYGAGATGTFDANGEDVTIGAGGLDCTNGGTAGCTLDLGSGTWLISGDFDWEDIDTLDRDTASLIKIDATATLTGKSGASGDLASLTIVSGNTVTVASGGSNFRVQKTLTIENTATFDIDGGREITSVETVVNSGTLTGTGSLHTEDGTITNTGTWSIDDTYFERGTVALNAGTYGGTCHFVKVAGPSKTATIGDGDITFTGNVIIDNDQGTNDYTFDNTANRTLIFQGDLTLSLSGGGGTLTFTPGTGTYTFSGNSNQTVTMPFGWSYEIGDVSITKTGGTIDFVTEFNCTDFNGGAMTGGAVCDPGGATFNISGNCDWDAAFDFLTDADAFNGSNWQIGGNFTADGQTLNANAGWDLDVTGTAVASGAGSVQQSTAGGTQIDASAVPWTDGGGNTNWNFGGAPSIDSGARMMVGCCF